MVFDAAKGGGPNLFLSEEQSPWYDVLGGKDVLSLVELEMETLDMWENGLVPHFRAECECLLARLARLDRDS